MVKQRDLMKVDFGDYTVIAEIYRQRNDTEVSVSYVRRVIKQECPAQPNTTAFEIIQIAKQYLNTKRKCKEQLIAA